jgi:hypothetical protein
LSLVLPHTCSPHQHSASWWPRLFADDPTDIAWDDAPKDYTDLPAPIAAAAAAQAAREEESRRQQEKRRAARDRLQVECCCQGGGERGRSKQRFADCGG